MKETESKSVRAFILLQETRLRIDSGNFDRDIHADAIFVISSVHLVFA